MVQFTTTILKFEEKGEKTGWTYIAVPTAVAQQLKPGNKKSFRVKGKLDNYTVEGIALMPIGDGNFIMPLNVTIRKGICKQKGAIVRVQIEIDNKPMQPSADLMQCLADEPIALSHFNTLPKSHQHYFTKWIESAKTETTKAKRIVQSVNALSQGFAFGEMLRMLKQYKNDVINLL